jgi:hypothetical protein
MAVSSDDRVWVAAGYDLFEFAVSDEAWSNSVSLSRQLELATETAVDQNEPLPGTWITGMLADESGRIWVARHNVTALFEAAAGRLTLSRTLPESPTSLRLHTGEVLPVRADVEGDRAIGRQEVPLQRGFIGHRCSLEADAREATLRAASDGAVAHLIVDGTFTPRDAIAVSTAGEHAAYALIDGGAVVRAKCGAGALELFKLGSWTAFPGLMSGFGQPVADDAPPIAIQLDPEAISIAEDGTLAYSDNQGRAYVLK